MQRFSLLILVTVVVLLSLAQPSLGQGTTVYFSYITNQTFAYPYVCGTGSLSCTLVSGTTANYTCQSLISGTHLYFPSATAPTFSSPFVTTLPATCEGYTASQALPIDAKGLNVQYGSTCINLYSSAGIIHAAPDARSSVVTFAYSTSASGVSTCPAAVAPTASGSATVGFVYTTRGTSGLNTNVIACGAGNLQCTSYGSGEYVCPTLVSGQQWVWNASTALSTPSLTSYTLSSETECNSFGDGLLPLDYEGISFSTNAGSRGCVSIYNYTSTSGAFTVDISYNAVSGTNTFAYQGYALNDLQQACASAIPALYVSSSSGVNNVVVGSSSSSGGSQNAASASYTSAVSMTVLLMVALLSVIAL